MKRLTVIILSLVLTLGVVGCSSSSDESSNTTTKEQQEEQTKAATTDDIKALLKDMYIILQDSDGVTKDCKEELVKYGNEIDESMIANEEYGDEMEVLKESINSYNLEEISGYVCNILNRIEGTEKYKIEIKSSEDKSTNKDANKSNSTDKSNTSKNQNSSSQSTTNKNSNNKNKTNQNNNNNKEEYESGDYGDYTKCPSCGKMTFHPNGYCENCGYKKKLNEDGANHDSQCKNCGSATINADGTCPYCGYKN